MRAAMTYACLRVVHLTKGGIPICQCVTSTILFLSTIHAGFRLRSPSNLPTRLEEDPFNFGSNPTPSPKRLKSELLFMQVKQTKRNCVDSLNYGEFTIDFTINFILSDSDAIFERFLTSAFGYIPTVSSLNSWYQKDLPGE